MAASVERPLRTRLLLAAAGAALFAAALAYRALYSPSVAYLPGGGAPWIVAPAPVGLRAKYTVPSFVHFRRRISVGPAAEGELRLRARRESQVVLDGRVVLPPGEAPGGWKNERRVTLRPAPGEHELLVVVRAEPGPAALSAEVKAWGLRTDESWQAAGEDTGWPQARLADAARLPEGFDRRPTALSSFLWTLFMAAPFAAWGAWRASKGLRRPWLWAGGAWTLLALLGLLRRPGGAGFDAFAHVELIRLLWTKGLPGPGDSWQSFQAPLYHALLAPLAASGFDDELLALLARLPNLLCGFGLALLAAGFAARARPESRQAAGAAGLFALMLAPNLYMSQSPGNEPLAALLAALFLALCLRLAPKEESAASGFLLGGVLGAALLAKTTAVLAVPAGLWLLGRRPRRWYGAAAAGVLLVGGWWYLRGWLLTGAFFTGGWDPARGIAWMQDPGYRTAGDFLRFGAALHQPVYAGYAGFWDALYSTLWLDGWQGGLIEPAALAPWPPHWQAAAALWGLVPTGLLLAGAWRALRRGDRPGLAALLGCATGLAALLWMFLSVPVYSTVKASYLLGLTPLAALLVADGMPERGSKRTLAWFVLSGWAACSFFAHFPQN
jgi:hypothetical protein